MDKKFTASVITLGCRVNQYESDYIMNELVKNGVAILKGSDACDLYVINTCSVTAESDRKSRQLIRRCIQKNPNAKVIVTGCYSQISPDQAKEINGVSLVIGNNAKSKIPEIALSLLKNEKLCCDYSSDIYSGSFDNMMVGAPLKRTRAFIKIQDGCDSKCAYCIIPYARGSVRSAMPENVINEVKEIAKKGCLEVVLTGIETASYGKDFKNGYSLADLMAEANKIDGIKRIRLGSLDPSAITKDFVDKIKGLDKVMPHFHISMQSGCTKTLNSMKRKYNIEMAQRNIDYLKEAFPNVMLSCDIITGFPGETDEDFDKTYDFLKSQRFLHMHLFPYSKRQGTLAATMKEQVPENIKKERLHLLESLEKEIKTSLLNDYVKNNKCIEVLFETFDGEYALGHTPNFIEVKVPCDKKISGEIRYVKPTHTDGEYVFAEFIK
ncbi:MAG: tRNA (N(6)-L-threonylcarbamoyladenosine(37)-C(2))-methylthiotransferase MtaB [Clostridia bacterium]|nr:tRNA (N(6)-L-threonylcarbamoyladenosine(37)-C(2))-methylthiotransferase MtaB [Clostridia bacterium]